MNRWTHLAPDDCGEDLWAVLEADVVSAGHHHAARQAHTELRERPLRRDEAVHHAHNSRGGEKHQQRPSEDYNLVTLRQIVIEKNKLDKASRHSTN